MPHRVFLDDHDVEWTIWDVHPSARDKLPRIADQLREGWLALQSAHVERRRVVPIPEGWETWSDDELRALLLRSDVRSIAPRHGPSANTPRP